MTFLLARHYNSCLPKALTLTAVLIHERCVGGVWRHPVTLSPTGRTVRVSVHGGRRLGRRVSIRPPVRLLAVHAVLAVLVRCSNKRTVNSGGRPNTAHQPPPHSDGRPNTAHQPHTATANARSDNLTSTVHPRKKLPRT